MDEATLAIITAALDAADGMLALIPDSHLAGEARDKIALAREALSGISQPSATWDEL